MLKNLEICETNYMFFVSQIIINVKQITQCYLIYLTFAKIKTQCYSTNFDLLYLYNFSKVASLNTFTQKKNFFRYYTNKQYRNYINKQYYKIFYNRFFLIL